MSSSPLPTLTSTKVKHHGVAMDRSSSSAVAASPLVTILRRMQPRDVEATCKALLSPTSTIPALRPRVHRGGESLLLKDSYPSGFCLSRHNAAHDKHHLNIGDDNYNNSLSRRVLSPYDPDNGYCLLSGKRNFGVPPWGGLIGRRVMTVTQLVLGDRAVQDAVGSELVQFGPGFSCDQPDQPSPLRLESNRGRATPASAMTLPCTTLDGLALEKENIDLAPSADEDNRQPCNSNRPITPESPCPTRRDDRSAAVEKTPARLPRTMKQRPESENGGLSRASFAQIMSLVASSVRPLTAAVRTVKVGLTHVVDGDREISTGDGSENEGRSEVARHPSAREEQGSEDLRKQPKPPLPGDNDGENVRGGAGAGAKNERGDRSGPRAVELVRVYEENGRIGSEWAAVTGDSLAVCQDGSACSLESVTSLEAPTVRSVSPSTLDTEKYGGNLSTDATKIMRSYVEWPIKDPGDVCTNFPQADAEAFFAPDPPPGISSKVPEGLFSPLGTSRVAIPSFAAAFGMPPLEQPHSGCYLRTRQDVILAVVRRGDLLECDDDVGLRRLKAAAVPVRVMADMTLKQGICAIVSSGMLRQDYGDVGEDSWGDQAGVSAALSGVGRVRGMPRAWGLEYFNSRAGTWDAVRNESDWKILLAAPAGRNGAGMNFRSFRGNHQGADFLVAVSPSPLASRSPEIRQRKTEIVSASASAKSKRSGCCHPAQVTAGSLASQEARQRPRNDGAENCSRETKQSPDLLYSKSAAPEMEELEKESYIELGRRLAGLTGGKMRRGPGPGAALWTSETNTNGKNAAFVPRKAQVRRLAKCLEARLQLKGQTGAGRSPAEMIQKTELPYTSELAKWGYDEILGIPRTAPVVTLENHR